MLRVSVPRLRAVFPLFSKPPPPPGSHGEVLGTLRTLPSSHGRSRESGGFGAFCATAPGPGGEAGRGRGEARWPEFSHGWVGARGSGISSSRGERAQLVRAMRKGLFDIDGDGRELSCNC